MKGSTRIEGVAAGASQVIDFMTIGEQTPY
jgi:hypothetical protein